MYEKLARVHSQQTNLGQGTFSLLNVHNQGTSCEKLSVIYLSQKFLESFLKAFRGKYANF